MNYFKKHHCVREEWLILMNAIVCDSKMYVYIETVTTQGGTKNLSIMVPCFRFQTHGMGL